MSTYTFKSRIWGDEFEDGRYQMHYPEDSTFHITMEGKVATCTNGTYGGGVTDTYGGTEENPGMIVLLFTGLTDVKGKDIYAGDVIGSLDSDGNQIRHLIEYQVEEARFGLTLLPSHRYTNLQEMRVNQRWIMEFKKEVIGNKYENPDLLD